MFGFGWMELLLVWVIVLIVFGAGELRQRGEGLRTAIKRSKPTVLRRSRRPEMKQIKVKGRVPRDNEAKGTINRRVAMHIKRRVSGWLTLAVLAVGGAMVASDPAFAKVDTDALTIGGEARFRYEGQIGRASCRERGEDVEGRGAVKGNRSGE